MSTPATASQRRHGTAVSLRVRVLAALAAAMLAAAAWSLCQGAMPLGVDDVAGALWRGIDGYAHGQDGVILALRLPRVLLALLVGSALAQGGAAMQGLFRNPLADPSLIGVSSGAALGAVAAIVMGGRSGMDPGPLGVPVCAFAGGLLATFVVYQLGRRRPGVATLLLAGVAVNAIAMAGVGLMTALASDRQLRDLTFWSMGSLGGITWIRLAVVAALVAPTLLLIPRHAKALNVLLLGEDEAGLLGFHPRRLQPWLIALVALSVSACVAATGVIGFLGLVVPHLLRLCWGPDHRLLLPASALAGAALLCVADAWARTVVAPAELPIGVLTALTGGPFFLWLLLRGRDRDIPPS